MLIIKYPGLPFDTRHLPHKCPTCRYDNPGKRRAVAHIIAVVGYNRRAAIPLSPGNRNTPTRAVARTGILPILSKYLRFLADCRLGLSARFWPVAVLQCLADVLALSGTR